MEAVGASLWINLLIFARACKGQKESLKMVAYLLIKRKSVITYQQIAITPYPKPKLLLVILLSMKNALRTKTTALITSIIKTHLSKQVACLVPITDKRVQNLGSVGMRLITLIPQKARLKFPTKLWSIREATSVTSMMTSPPQEDIRTMLLTMELAPTQLLLSQFQREIPSRE